MNEMTLGFPQITLIHSDNFCVIQRNLREIIRHLAVNDTSLEFRHIDPTSLLPAFNTFFRQLDSFGSLFHIPRERLILHHMFEEQFPLYLKGIVKNLLLGNLGPAVKKVNGLYNIRIPDRLRRIAIMLDVTFPQACYCRSFCTIHLQGQEIVPSYPYRPRGVKMGYDISFQFEGGISGIVSGTFVRLALLVHAFLNMGSTKTGDSFHFPEDIVQDISPVAKHVHDNSPIVFLTVIPRGPLGWNGIPFKHPVAKFPSHR